MKSIILCLTLAFAVLQSPAARAETITKADIIKTVEHLQQRCHEAEAAQVAAQAKLPGLQKSIDAIAAQRDAAQKDLSDMTTSRDFWRRATWKTGLSLGCLSLALGIWIFRKPILALCGV